MKVFCPHAAQVTAEARMFLDVPAPFAVVEIRVEEASRHMPVGHGVIELHMSDILHAQRLVDAINAAAPRLPVDEGVA